MKFLEKDLEEVIFNASKEALEDRGLDGFYSKRRRQVKIGNYGVADIICLYRETDWGSTKEGYWVEGNTIRINIVELKQETISISAFLQAVRYLKGIQRYIMGREIFADCNIEYTITLVGKKIDLSSDLIYLPDLIDNYFLDVRFYTYDFDLEKGLMFKCHHNYALKNEGFKFPRK